MSRDASCREYMPAPEYGVLSRVRSCISPPALTIPPGNGYQTRTQSIRKAFAITPIRYLVIAMTPCERHDVMRGAINVLAVSSYPHACSDVSGISRLPKLTTSSCWNPKRR